MEHVRGPTLNDYVNAHKEKDHDRIVRSLQSVLVLMAHTAAQRDATVTMIHALNMCNVAPFDICWTPEYYLVDDTSPNLTVVAIELSKARPLHLYHRSNILTVYVVLETEIVSLTITTASEASCNWRDSINIGSIPGLVPWRVERLTRSQTRSMWIRVMIQGSQNALLTLSASVFTSTQTSPINCPAMIPTCRRNSLLDTSGLEFT